MKMLMIKLLGFLLVASAVSSAAVSSRISSKFLAAGERALLEVLIDGKEPDQPPTLGEIDGVTVQLLDFGMRQNLRERRQEYVYQYVVVCYTIGKHQIPSLEMDVNGILYKTEPINFQVFDIEELDLSRVVAKPTQFRDEVAYASILKVGTDSVYENQAVEAEIKVYVPSSLADTMRDWGVPEFERSGLGAWRFEASELQGSVTYLGQSYSTKAYSTTLSALRSGDVSIGPATVRLTYEKTIFDRFAQRIIFQAMLDVPQVDLNVSPLPEGAPDGFDNAVGQFSIDVTMGDVEVKEGEPISVDVIVRGSGNLDKLRSPKMTDESGWKVYDATPQQRGDERRELSGSVVFSQFIRPLEMKTSVPSFRLVFFNPETEEYETVTSEFIPIEMSPSTAINRVESSGPPQALPIPVERMTDILGLIKGRPLLEPSGSPVPGWVLHLLGGLVALVLILKALWMRFGHLMEKDEMKMKKKREFTDISQSVSGDGVTFLKSAGGFIESWLSEGKNKDLVGILEERDRLCFRVGKEKVSVSQQRRNEILKVLRKAAFVIFMTAALILPVTVHAQEGAQKAYDSADYEKAAKIWLDAGSYEDLSADTLYNIGNAAYRMSASGQAALYYRRAMVKEPLHEEAKQNLRFIERKFGSITVERPEYRSALGKVSIDLWRGGAWAGVWILLLGVLVFPATRPNARVRVGGVIGFIVGPILAAVGAFGWYFYPDDAEFVPLARQGVIVGEKVILHTDAARTSPEVINAPPGSLAEVIRRSGDWAYIGFATKTRGWVPAEFIEMVVPDEKPEPPKVRKVAADGSSA